MSRPQHADEALDMRYPISRLHLESTMRPRGRRRNSLIYNSIKKRDLTPNLLTPNLLTPYLRIMWITMSTKEEKELIDPVDLIESYIHCKEAIRNDLLAKILVKISCKEKIFAKAANNKIWKSVLQCKSLQDRSRLCLWVSLCNISINSDVLLDVVNYENDNKMKYRWLRVIYSKTIDNPSYINKKSIKTLESMIVMPIDSNSYTMIMNILHIHRNSNEV